MESLVKGLGALWVRFSGNGSGRDGKLISLLREPSPCPLLLTMLEENCGPSWTWELQQLMFVVFVLCYYRNLSNLNVVILKVA